MIDLPQIMQCFEMLVVIVYSIVPLADFFSCFIYKHHFMSHFEVYAVSCAIHRLESRKPLNISQVSIKEGSF